MKDFTNLELEVLSRIVPTRRNTILDLGTDISAEMYSNSNKKEKKKLKKKENTFQQSTEPSAPTDVNVGAQAPHLSLPRVSPSRGEKPEEEKEIGSSANNGYGRRLNIQKDKIVEMHLQIAHIKKGDRHSRAKAYLSIKTESDVRYMIFMRSAITTASDETFRSINKDCDRELLAVAQELYSEKSNQQLFMGRVKYKPTKNSKIKDHHRKNLPKTLLAIWQEDKIWHAVFYLIDDYYHFVLDEPITERQSKFYEMQGTWHYEESTMSMEDAFNG